MIWSAQSILDRLVSKIEAAPIDPEPSDNIYMEGLFEPALYKEIIERLPHRGAYEFLNHPQARLEDGSYTRLMFDLTEQSIERVQGQDRKFWRLMSDVFLSADLRKSLLQKFRSRIDERFNGEWPEMISVPVFYKDYPGYYIGPHPDGDIKVATFQLYFPVDESQIHLGTSFNCKEDDHSRILKTNLFKPNSGYAFARTDTSWHSVKQMGPHEAERNSLALTIYIKDKQYKFVVDPNAAKEYQ